MSSRPEQVSLDDLARVLAGAAVVLDAIVLAARRGGIGHCCAGSGCASAGLRHQYRVRKAGVETNSAGPDRAAAAKPHCVALLRGGGTDARTDRSADDGAEDHFVGARCVGRTPRNHRATAGHAGARRLSAGAAAGIGRRIRRSGAARAYDRRHDRRGAGARRRQDRAGPRCAGRGRSRADHAGAEGRPRLDQRHAVFDGLCHFRAAARPWTALRDAGDRRLVGRCGDGFDGAVPPGDSATARACRTDRGRRRR